MYIFYNIYLKYATFLRDNVVIFTTKKSPYFLGRFDALILLASVWIRRNEAFLSFGRHDLNMDVVLTGKEETLTNWEV